VAFLIVKWLMVLFVLPSVSHMAPLSGNIGIFRLQSIAFKHDFIFKEVEFDLEPLMFNEALLLTISPEFAWKYTWDPALKIAFFCRNSSVK
jgi:hypothetical protein